MTTMNPGPGECGPKREKEPWDKTFEVSPESYDSSFPEKPFIQVPKASYDHTRGLRQKPTFDFLYVSDSNIDVRHRLNQGLILSPNIGELEEFLQNTPLQNMLSGIQLLRRDISTVLGEIVKVNYGHAGDVSRFVGINKIYLGIPENPSDKEHVFDGMAKVLLGMKVNVVTPGRGYEILSPQEINAILGSARPSLQLGVGEHVKEVKKGLNLAFSSAPYADVIQAYCDTGVLSLEQKELVLAYARDDEETIQRLRKEQKPSDDDLGGMVDELLKGIPGVR